MLLLNASGQVVGTTAVHRADDVFVVSVDASGNVTLDQQRAVVHTNPNDPDESRGLTGIGSGDADGDCYRRRRRPRRGAARPHAAARLQGRRPEHHASAVHAPTLTVDETALATDATASFAAQFTSSFGADGAAAATPVSYALLTPGGASGLTDTASGNAVFLLLESGQVVGREGTDAAAAAGDIVFTVSVTPTAM